MACQTKKFKFCTQHVTKLSILSKCAHQNQQQLTIIPVPLHWKLTQFHVKCSKCEPLTITQALSLFLNARMARSIGSCGKSVQIAFNTFLSFVKFFGFGEYTWFLSNIASANMVIE